MKQDLEIDYFLDYIIAQRHQQSKFNQRNKPTCKRVRDYTLHCKCISFIEYKQKSQKHKYIENIPKQLILTAINGSKSLDTEEELTNFILSQCFGQCLSLKQSSRNKFWKKKISQNILIGITPFIKYSNVPLCFRILTEKRAGGWDCLNIE